MKLSYLPLFSIPLSVCFGSLAVLAAPLPLRVGQCSNTTVKWVGTRLEDANHQPIPDSGSSIRFSNGGYQVSYDTLDAIAKSRPGDQVKLCLMSIPSPCPPGDNRGKIYQTLNLRTGKSWTLPDSQHFCGGA
jgi:hypothetical protein